MTPPAPPSPLPSYPGLIRWTPIPGADAYEVWLVDTGKVEYVRTNVLDERDFYTFHQSQQWTGTVRWRIRALRGDQFNQRVNGLPVAQHGAWSPVYSSTNPVMSSGKLQLVGTVSDVFSNGSASSPAHEMMPAFLWSGNQTASGAAAELYRVEIFTDKQCLNRVYTSAVVGGPAWAPRLNGPLALPTDAAVADRGAQPATSATARSRRATPTTARSSTRRSSRHRPRRRPPFPATSRRSPARRRPTRRPTRARRRLVSRQRRRLDRDLGQRQPRPARLPLGRRLAELRLLLDGHPRRRGRRVGRHRPSRLRARRRARRSSRWSARRASASATPSRSAWLRASTAARSRASAPAPITLSGPTNFAHFAGEPVVTGRRLDLLRRRRAARGRLRRADQPRAAARHLERAHADERPGAVRHGPLVERPPHLGRAHVRLLRRTADRVDAGVQRRHLRGAVLEDAVSVQAGGRSALEREGLHDLLDLGRPARSKTGTWWYRVRGIDFNLPTGVQQMTLVRSREARGRPAEVQDRHRRAQEEVQGPAVVTLGAWTPTSASPSRSQTTPTR